MSQNLFVWFELPAAIKQHLRANVEINNPDGDLHITAFYQKDVRPEVADAFLAALRQEVQRWRPIRAATTGAGVFDGAGDDGRMPLIYLINAPGLERWRVKMLELFERALGAEPTQRFGYIPHLTLLYVEPDQELEHGWEVEMVQKAPPPWMMGQIGIKYGEAAFMIEAGSAGYRALRHGEGA